MGKNNVIDLDGITFGDKHVSRYIAEKEVEEKTKKIQQTHMEQTKAPARLPIGKPKHKPPRASRAGKVRYLTTKEIEMEYKSPQDYKTGQQKVIAALLKFEEPATLKEIHQAAPEVARKSISPILSRLAGTLGPNFEKDKDGKGLTTYAITGPDKQKTVKAIDKAVKLKDADNRILKYHAKAMAAAGATKEAGEPVRAESMPPDDYNDDKPYISLPRLVGELEEMLHRVPNGVTVKFTVEITGAKSTPLKWD